MQPVNKNIGRKAGVALLTKILCGIPLHVKNLFDFKPRMH